MVSDTPMDILVLGDYVVPVETACWTRKSDEDASDTPTDTLGMGESKTAIDVAIATLRRPHEVGAGQKGSDQQICLRRVSSGHMTQQLVC